MADIEQRSAAGVPSDQLSILHHALGIGAGWLRPQLPQSLCHQGRRQRPRAL